LGPYSFPIFTLDGEEINNIGKVKLNGASLLETILGEFSTQCKTLELNAQVQNRLESRLRNMEYLPYKGIEYKDFSNTDCYIDLLPPDIEGNVKTLNGFGEVYVNYQTSCSVKNEFKNEVYYSMFQVKEALIFRFIMFFKW
jgi:hypothetical protein